jgi:lipopolysaccharide export system permease protein
MRRMATGISASLWPEAEFPPRWRETQIHTGARNGGPTPRFEIHLFGYPMTIFERYVFRQAGGALLIILLSLSGIVWVALALRQLNVVTSQGQDALMLVKMTTLALPNLMAIIAPFSLLIAAIHTLNRLNSDSELIVLTASGANVWRSARPLILLSVLVAIFVGFVNHLAMPWSMRTLRQYIVQVRTDILTQVIQPGQFSSPEDNLTFHIRERTLNGELLGLIVHDTRDKAQSQSYLAERGIIVKREPSNYLIMSQGHIVRRASKDEPAQIVAFEKYAVDLDRFEKKMDEDSDDLKPRERYFDELVHPEATSNGFRQAPGKFRAELHERSSNPFYPIAFAMIALAAVGQAHSTRQSSMRQITSAFVLAAGLRLGGLALNNVVILNAAAVPLLYALPLVAILLPALSIERGRRRLANSRLGAIIDAISSMIIAPLGRLIAFPVRALGARG